MNWIRNKQQWRDYLLITLGTAVMAVATSSIYDPAGLVTGGFSGLAIVIKQLSQMLFGKGVPLWVTNLVLNIPLFLFGIRMSRDFLVKTIFGTLMNTFWIAVLPVLQLVPDDRMLSALFGGVLMGAGIGLVFIGNGTTGGTDMMAALIQRKLRHYSVAQVMQVLDGIIVIAGIFVFGIHASLYAIVAIYVTTKVTDALMEGMNYAKSAFIITAHPEQVADELMKELDHPHKGNVHGRRAYDGILCCGQKTDPAAQTDRRNDRSGRVCRCVGCKRGLRRGLPDGFLLTFLRILWYKCCVFSSFFVYFVLK